MLRFVVFGYGLLAACAPAHAQLAALLPAVVAVANGQDAPVTPTIYLAADEMPTFAGGEAGLAKFLAQTMQYPAQALDRGVSGKVHVRFTVDAEGRVLAPVVVKGCGAGLDEEALRLVRLMPWWTPGKVAGQPVWVSVTMPIVFRAL